MVKRQGIKTLLSGEGSDEIFMGYNIYSKVKEFDDFKNTLSLEQTIFLKNNLKSQTTTTKEMDYLKRILNKHNLYTGFGEIFTLEQKNKLFNITPIFPYPTQKKDIVDWMSYIDVKIWLGEALLSKVDKVSMSNSIEIRNPFLDVSMVNLAFQIDSKIKMGDTNKYLLKNVAKKYIPKQIISRDKKGFNSPYNEWLHEHYSNNLLEIILEANKKHHLFNIEYLKELYIASKNNKQKLHFYALWNFSIWYLKTYN
jgi:asparagine synthase (glutamine-hydrolysing)